MTGSTFSQNLNFKDHKTICGYRYQHIQLNVKARTCKSDGDIKDFLTCFKDQLAQQFFDLGMKCVPIHYEEFLSNKIQENGSYTSCTSEDDFKSMKIFEEYYKNLLLNYSKHESGLTCQVPCQTDTFQLTSTRLGVTAPELGKNYSE